MKIAETLRLLLSPRQRLLDGLAAIAEDNEALAANLSRHAEMCTFPTLRASLEQVAAAETAQAGAMRDLLLQNGVLPRLPGRPLHEGSSNWERLRNDLVLQVKILRALHTQLAEWTSIDQQLAERLRALAAQQDRWVEQLRDVTLKCDPQALD